MLFCQNSPFSSRRKRRNRRKKPDENKCCQSCFSTLCTSSFSPAHTNAFSKCFCTSCRPDVILFRGLRFLSWVSILGLFQMLRFQNTPRLKALSGVFIVDDWRKRIKWSLISVDVGSGWTHCGLLCFWRLGLAAQGTITFENFVTHFQDGEVGTVPVLSWISHMPDMFSVLSWLCQNKELENEDRKPKTT